MTAAKISASQSATTPSAARVSFDSESYALPNGDSTRAIAGTLRVGNNIVVAIREQDWQQAAARKQPIAAQAERNATFASDRITDELASNKHIPLNALVPVFGVNVDKF